MAPWAENDTRVDHAMVSANTCAKPCFDTSPPDCYVSAVSPSGCHNIPLHCHRACIDLQCTCYARHNQDVTILPKHCLNNMLFAAITFKPTGSGACIARPSHKQQQLGSADKRLPYLPHAMPMLPKVDGEGPDRRGHGGLHKPWTIDGAINGPSHEPPPVLRANNSNREGECEIRGRVRAGVV